MKSVRASTQIIDGTITNTLLEDVTLTNAKISPAAAIELSKLAEAIIKADGTSALTADWDISAGAFTILLPSPTLGSHVATKSYVDIYAQGLKLKGSVLSATTVGDGNIAISGTGTTIDGESLSVDDRVLLTQQTDPIENGIWVVQTLGWIRPDDFADGMAAAAAHMFVQEGTSYADTAWVCTNNTGADTIGTHALVFTQYSGSGNYTASGGLQLIGNDFSLAPLGVDTPHIALNSVGDAHIDFGGAAGQVNAKDLPFVTGHTYGGAAADVMDALEELWISGLSFSTIVNDGETVVADAPGDTLNLLGSEAVLVDGTALTDTIECSIILDGAALSITASGLTIRDDGVDSQHYATDSIDPEHINWGGGATEVNAGDIPFETVHAYGGTATQVMDGLEELWSRRKTNAGNPNGSITGVVGDILKDTANSIMYICKTAGSAGWVVI